MKIDLTNSQWSDIKLCLLMAISHTEKSSSIDFEDNPLIKRYLKTHDEIAVAMENKKTELPPEVQKVKNQLANFTIKSL